MDTLQENQPPKLTITTSSLIHSCPSVLPSSIPSVMPTSHPQAKALRLHDQKPRTKLPIRPTVRSHAATLLILLSVLSLYTLFAFSRREDDISTSEILLFALILVAVLLSAVSKNMGFVGRYFRLCKKSCVVCGKRLGISSLASRKHSKSVQWFIGGSDLNKMEGEVQQGISFRKAVTEGVEFYSNGDFYEGKFHGGRCNGSGVYNFIANGRYEGDWVDGSYDGYGVESWARGSRYRGQYKQGLRHGYGVYRFYTGDAYAGEWCNGQSHGIGVQTCADGSCYIGEFKTGVKHGLGCYYFRNGDKYAGEYFGDKIHGFGVYHFANGHRYEGSWHEGRKQGYGMYTFWNHETKSGEWDGSNLRAPLLPLADSILQAVQAARKTAENAIHLCRVDEQVNKAVASANRAATAARVAAVKAVQNRTRGNFCDTNM